MSDATQTSEPVRLSPLRFLVLADASDTWGHGVPAFDDVEGSFALESSAIMTGRVTNKLYECWTYQHSTIEAIYSLYDRLPYIYIDLIVNWQEHRKILKMEIQPAERKISALIMQAAGGVIQRQANGLELPLHQWVWLPTDAGNIAIIQDGAFACDCKPDRLRLTLVRSSLYGYDQQTPLNPIDPQNLTDQGEHCFRLCVLTAQDWHGASLDHLAQAFVEPYLVIREG